MGFNRQAGGGRYLNFTEPVRTVLYLHLKPDIPLSQNLYVQLYLCTLCQTFQHPFGRFFLRATTLNSRLSCFINMSLSLGERYVEKYVISPSISVAMSHNKFSGTRTGQMLLNLISPPPPSGMMYSVLRMPATQRSAKSFHQSRNLKNRLDKKSRTRAPEVSFITWKLLLSRGNEEYSFKMAYLIMGERDIDMVDSK